MILPSVLFFFFLLLLNWKPRMLLLVSAASFSPLSQSWGFGGRVFLRFPWLHRCCSVSLYLPSLSLSPTVACRCIVLSQSAPAECSAVQQPVEQTRSTDSSPGLSLPSLSWESRGRPSTAQSHNFWRLCCWDIFNNKGSHETMCCPGFDSFLKWSMTQGHGVKSHQHWCCLIMGKTCLESHSQHVFMFTTFSLNFNTDVGLVQMWFYWLGFADMKNWTCTLTVKPWGMICVTA